MSAHLVFHTWSQTKAHSRYPTALSPSYTRTANEFPWSSRSRASAAAAPEIIAASDKLLPVARFLAAGTGVGEGAALKTEQMVQLSRQLRQDGWCVRQSNVRARHRSITPAGGIKRFTRGKSWHIPGVHFTSPFGWSGLTDIVWNTLSAKRINCDATRFLRSPRATRALRGKSR